MINRDDPRTSRESGALPSYAEPSQRLFFSLVGSLLSLWHDPKGPDKPTLKLRAQL